MRKLYVVPKDVWFAHTELFSHQIGSHYIDLAAEGEAITTHDDILAAWAQGQDIDGSMILVATAFHSEWPEDFWEELGAVAVLPHPTFEGNVPLGDTNLDSPAAKAIATKGRHPHEGKKVRQHHIDALKKHPALGFLETDTVLTLSRKAQAVCPEVRVRGLR